MTWRSLLLLLGALAGVSWWSRLPVEFPQGLARDRSPGRAPSPEPPWSHPPVVAASVQRVTMKGVAPGMTTAQVARQLGPPAFEHEDGFAGYGGDKTAGQCQVYTARHARDARSPNVVAHVHGEQLEGDGRVLLSVPARITYSELEQCLGRPDQIWSWEYHPVFFRLTYRRLSLHLTLTPLDSLNWECQGCDNPDHEAGLFRTPTPGPDGDVVFGVGPPNATCYWWAQGRSWDKISDAWLRRHDFRVSEVYLGEDLSTAKSWDPYLQRSTP